MQNYLDPHKFSFEIGDGIYSLIVHGFSPFLSMLFWFCYDKSRSTDTNIRSRDSSSSTKTIFVVVFPIESVFSGVFRDYTLQVLLVEISLSFI